MKITYVKPMAIKIPVEDTFGGKGLGEAGKREYFPQPGWIGLYSRQIETMVVKIETDGGIVGFGEGQAPIGPEVTATVVDRVLRPILMGRDPMQGGVLRHEMYTAMNIRGHFTGFMLDAISGVDSALWDIKGKRLGVPVYELLGGAFRKEAPVYISGVRGNTAAEQAQTARTHVAEGFRTLKVFLGFGEEEDFERIRAVKEAIGSEGRLAVDVLWRYDIATAVRYGLALERMGIAWFETPTDPEDIAGSAEIARALTIPVGNAETDRTREQFLRWFQARGLDIAQPDVGRCGITEGRKIADLAEAFHIPVSLHMGICSAPMIAASLHVAASTPNFFLQEYQPIMLEAANRFLKRPLVCERGAFRVPDGPGLGIEIDEEALKPYVVYP